MDDDLDLDAPMFSAPTVPRAYFHENRRSSEGSGGYSNDGYDSSRQTHQQPQYHGRQDTGDVHPAYRPEQRPAGRMTLTLRSQQQARDTQLQPGEVLRSRSSEEERRNYSPHNALILDAEDISPPSSARLDRRRSRSPINGYRASEPDARPWPGEHMQTQRGTRLPPAADRDGRSGQRPVSRNAYLETARLQSYNGRTAMDPAMQQGYIPLTGPGVPPAGRPPAPSHAAAQYARSQPRHPATGPAAAGQMPVQQQRAPLQGSGLQPSRGQAPAHSSAARPAQNPPPQHQQQRQQPAAQKAAQKASPPHQQAPSQAAVPRVQQEQSRVEATCIGQVVSSRQGNGIHFCPKCTRPIAVYAIMTACGHIMCDDCCPQPSPGSNTTVCPLCDRPSQVVRESQMFTLFVCQVPVQRRGKTEPCCVKLDSFQSLKHHVKVNHPKRPLAAGAGSATSSAPTNSVGEAAHLPSAGAAPPAQMRSNDRGPRPQMQRGPAPRHRPHPQPQQQQHQQYRPGFVQARPGMPAYSMGPGPSGMGFIGQPGGVFGAVPVNMGIPPGAAAQQMLQRPPSMGYPQHPPSGGAPGGGFQPY